ncbi:5'-methylthioadenosine/S-adenosylhomocysteine nucleosidase [Paraglaciecola aquimarina]|uniref:5'-methylthioadenosine/S-adenosylhomocysteine nucleosidase n=1 Tax=Paraglaciecola algarum TaxID=3050085 RepID=A0ABS9DAV2_9ALTE|nr:5'-methylthioadenosine/S-adenosylhomocysteine nucleosidase [Paraglaciecola sp. G1-23]MCF2949517.1 5'-methylthioadenosine/S-adenosylhomocysteine nucleosidase [Paraglaciecola sp. G1-23]
MKVAILGAMDEEITLIRDSLQNCQEHNYNHLTAYVGLIGNVQVSLVKCGIGKVAAAVSTVAVINHFNPDYVINTGSAGGFLAHLNIGDIVIGTSLRHHDADLTHFGYELGQNAGMPAGFSADQTLINCATKAINQLPEIQVEQGLICTGDSFVGSDEAAEVIRKNFPSVCAVEMEGVAIAQTCFLLETPFLVIRSLSDIAGKTSTVSFQTYLEQAAKNSAQLVMQTIVELAETSNV